MPCRLVEAFVDSGCAVRKHKALHVPACGRRGISAFIGAFLVGLMEFVCTNCLYEPFVRYLPMASQNNWSPEAAQAARFRKGRMSRTQSDLFT